MENKNAKLLIEFENWMRLRHLSSETIGTYMGHINAFINYHNNKEAYRINHDQIIAYLLRYQSASSHNQIKATLQNFYTHIVKQSTKIADLPNAKREQKLPEVLTKEEVRIGMSKITNMKHKCIVKLLYGCGFRLSDVLNMQPDWIKRHAKVIVIRQGKGKKDRQVMLDDGLLLDLENITKNTGQQDTFLKVKLKARVILKKAFSRLLKRTSIPTRMYYVTALPLIYWKLAQTLG